MHAINKQPTETSFFISVFAIFLLALASFRYCLFLIFVSKELELHTSARQGEFIHIDDKYYDEIDYLTDIICKNIDTTFS